MNHIVVYMCDTDLRIGDILNQWAALIARLTADGCRLQRLIGSEAGRALSDVLVLHIQDGDRAGRDERRRAVGVAGARDNEVEGDGCRRTVGGRSSCVRVRLPV